MSKERILLWTARVLGAVTAVGGLTLGPIGPGSYHGSEKVQNKGIGVEKETLPTSATEKADTPPKEKEYCYVVTGMAPDCSGGTTVGIYQTGQEIKSADGHTVVFQRGPCGVCQPVENPASHD